MLDIENMSVQAKARAERPTRRTGAETAAGITLGTKHDRLKFVVFDAKQFLGASSSSTPSRALGSTMSSCRAGRSPGGGVRMTLRGR